MARMTIALALYALIAAPVPAWPQDPNAAAREYGRAMGAYFGKDFAGFRDGAARWLAVVPHSTEALYELAAAHALLGENEKAVELLERVADRRLGFDPRIDPRFAPLVSNLGYKRLVERLEVLEPRVHRATVATVIAEPDLIPEGIAVDPSTQTIYVGSLAKEKIVAVDARGRARDFVKSGRDGLWDVLGMKVDTARRLLWVCTAASAAAGKDAGASALLAFDLGSGRRKHRFAVPADRKHLFNDLAIAPGGDVFLTDSEAGAIYRLPNGAAALERFLPYETLYYPNGIAATPDGRSLLVASSGRGVSRIDVATKAILDIATGPDSTLAGIDGLYLHGRDLIAVQNAIGLGRVMRYSLSPALDRVVGSEVLESRSVYFDIPTTGSIAGNDFYVLANSQLRQLLPDNSIADRATLRDVVILRLGL